MSFLIEFLKLYGIHVHPALEGGEILWTLLICLLVLTLISLLCVFNLLAYVIINYMMLDSIWLNRILNSLPKRMLFFATRFIKYYKSTSLYFIIFDVLLLLSCLSYMIYLILTILYKITSA